MKKGVSHEERDKALKEMFGSETEQTTILDNAQPVKRKEVVVTSECPVPDKASVHTPPKDGGEMVGVTTATLILMDNPEVVASFNENDDTGSTIAGSGKISGRTTIPIIGDEVGAHTSLSPLSEQPEPTGSTSDSGIIVETQPIADPDSIRRTAKQRRSELNEYRATFLPVPKIIDRKPVFVSRTTRDRLDRIVRLLGERGMSVSGLVENIALHHLAVHETDIEHWRKM
jgi:hypothetical protein